MIGDWWLFPQTPGISAERLPNKARFDMLEEWARLFGGSKSVRGVQGRWTRSPHGGMRLCPRSHRQMCKWTLREHKRKYEINKYGPLQNLNTAHFWFTNSVISGKIYLQWLGTCNHVPLWHATQRWWPVIWKFWKLAKVVKSNEENVRKFA